MAVSNIFGLVLILLVPETKADAICYHLNGVYGYIEYTGYCYQGCCSSQCCENTTTEAPRLDDSTVAAIVLGCVLGFALLVAIIVIIGLCCYYKQNTRNQIQCGQVLSAPQTYPLMFQGTYSHTPPGHLSPFSHNHMLGVSFRPSHGLFQSDLGGQHARIEMTQFPNGQRNDPLGYHPELETTQFNHGQQNDPPGYEPLPDTTNGTPPLAAHPDEKH
ncbi:uncharacterized protein LOC110452032 [Mizuhopecten yessoensis]|uniref:Uncharacterized protein n=1 Tax=Mizuhopecten yessoensis TaxID=6573 RepID=A0A210QKI1_MIZYE|nr:uncharacterized protein LOC110452032 [Mizuhopecten yessoensis]OWF49259.1 hypothetical protein KP79_PYT16932 [Mizuhopecten yessoensis]